MYRLLTIICSLFVAGPLLAQLDRRNRDEPEMFIEAGGRSGTCDVLHFSPDGRFLYAGGDDKVVRVWEVGANGIKSGSMTTRRWPAWRDQRGGIKTLALPADPADRRLFIAGFGLKNGLTVVEDKNGEILATNEIDGLVTPTQNVMSSTFTPDGKSVIYGTSDGKLWHWDLGTHHALAAAHQPSVGMPFNRPRMIRFLDDSSFLSVAENGQVLKVVRKGENWEASELFQLKNEFAKAFKGLNEPVPQNPHSLYRADLSPDGAWLACSYQPNYVVLCSLKGEAPKLIKLPHVARAVAFAKDGRLAIASTSNNTQNKFWLEGNDEIWIFDKVTDEKPTTRLLHTFRAEAMAWSPDGLLAVAGGESHEVTLWNPKKPAAPLSVIRGKGRGLWECRLGKDGESFLFRSERNAQSIDPNVRGQGEWQAFNYAIGKPVEAGTPLPILTTADNWTIVPSDESAMIWNAVLTKEGAVVARHPLKIDPDRDEQPRCYTFLPAKGKLPTRVLVGHYHGFSLFELTPESATRTMLGTGQAGDVTSIAADPDQRVLITSSIDQTIAGWSMNPFPSGPFGTEFVVEGGKLKAKNIDVGSHAWEMGILGGDEILLVVRTEKGKSQVIYAVAGKYAGKDLPNQGTPIEAVQALQKPTPGIEYYLAWKRPKGETQSEGLTSVRRRPLWKFFPGFDENNRFAHWVAWIWRGSQYATSTSGDFLVGWQLNDPQTITKKRPEFFFANRFKEQLNRKLTVLRLMQTADLEAALKEISGDNPQPPKFGLYETPPVQLATETTEVGPEGIKIDLTVSPQGRNPDLLPERVELWINDYRFDSWTADKKEVSRKLTIPADQFRSGENQITVLTFNGSGGRGEARAKVLNAASSQQPRVLGLLVGINDYGNSKVVNADGTREFGNLKNAHQDAEALMKLWKMQSGPNRLYEKDQLILSLDSKASKKEILQSLETLAQTARPDDRVIIFLAGHGDFVNKPKGSKGEKIFVFCCPDYDRSNYEETGITAPFLIDALAKVRARKLILLDACHSGGAASEDIVRQLVPEGQGPLVIAACDQKELSYEHPAIGHGLFTAALLEALNKPEIADSNRDSQVDPKEIYAYIRKRIPALLKETGKSAHLQNPQAFPPDLATYPIAK
jgi:WD40 repeat protein